MGHRGKRSLASILRRGEKEGLKSHTLKDKALDETICTLPHVDEPFTWGEILKDSRNRGTLQLLTVREEDHGGWRAT